jgi:ribonuclease III
MPVDNSPLEHNLNYRFRDPELMIEALRHSSFVNEQAAPPPRDNERLEFLGDAVLNLIIGHLLMRAFPDMKEGDLSRLRANLVNETQLAAIARGLNLGAHLLLGKGEHQTNGRDKDSILADALEALIAAVYLDGGFAATFAILERHFGPLISEHPSSINGQDFKSRLQEVVQATLQETPRYRIVSESGPDHDKRFCVAMTVGAIESRGEGKSKKLAEQAAARNGLALLQARQGGHG